MAATDQTPKRADYVIIGAGLAGMSTAWGLGLLGEHDVVILEKEDFPGMHSSGRNAAMIRQITGGGDVQLMARLGARFFAGHAPGWDEKPPFRRSGSILTAGTAGWPKLQKQAAASRDTGVKLELWEPERIRETVPCTADGDLAGGVFCPGDGVTDTDALLQGFWNAARRGGARLVTSCEVRNIGLRNGRIDGVETSRGFIETRKVVNAAGPWAGMVGRMAGAVDIEFTPLRRHLYFTGELDWADRDWPFVWDLERELYFRPESGGLLLSPCDESPAEPALPLVDDSVQDVLAEKLSAAFPRLLDAPIARGWAGLRTFAPDRAFVLGHDHLADGFYWVAALGGHGVTTSPSVGRMAAEDISGKGGTAPSAFSPARFA